MVVMSKPAYNIPTVAEIRKLSGTSGLVAASTFAGCGGSSTGYRWAGYDVRWASEYLGAAADTYEANWPEATVDRRDVRDVSGDEILEAVGVGRGEMDLFDGSPPCQPFSLAGTREKGWRKTVEHGDGTSNRGGSEDLMSEWLRLVDEMRPRSAVMENVRGLTVGKAKGYLLRVMDDVRKLGYNVETRLLDAQWLGVPQRRVRVILIAVRDDVGRPEWPEPLPYRYSIADACPEIRAAEMRFWGKRHDPIDVDMPSPTIVATGAEQNRPVVVAEAPEGDGPSIGGYAIGEEWRRLSPEEQSKRYFSLVRASPDLPSPTIVAVGGNAGTAAVTHPFEERKFTVGELRRLSGFPDDYILLGKYVEQWARLGNSVPPPMARAVGEALIPVLKR